jgi:NHLM bacteriocin system ABC transporter peptidase/ATP-binding protein
MSAPPAPPPAPVAAASKRRRVHTPTLLQMEAVECGAAALGMVLAHWGRVVPLEELRVACGVSRDGSNAANVLKAARAYGLEAHGYQREPGALPELPLPMIIFWNFNHFLVVEGFGKHKVYLNDPAVGPRTISYAELDAGFTGVVLTFQPGAEFHKGGQRPSFVKALAGRLHGSWAGLLYCVLVGLLLVLPGLIAPIFSKIFVDNYLVGGMRGWIGPLLLGMALTALLTAVLTWVQQRYLLRLSMKLAVSMSSQFLWHVLRLPMEFYTQRYGGEISWRVSINDVVAQLLSGQLASAGLNVITVVFYVGLMFLFDVPLTLIGIAFAALNLVALRHVSRLRIDLNGRLLQEQGKLMATAMSGLQTIETLKASGGESDFFARWAGYQAKVLNARQALGVPTQILNTVPPLLTLLTTAAILVVGGLRVMQGDLTVGTLVAFQSLMASFLAPFGQFVALGSQLQEAQGGLNKLDDVLRSQTDPTLDAPGGRPPADGAGGAARANGAAAEAVRGAGAAAPSRVAAGIAAAVGGAPAAAGAPPAKLSGRLELRDVTFGYSPLAPPLIEHFDLAVQPGQRVALVGTSGSGKSTIGKLVSGLFQPWSGEVLVDGRPRASIPRDVLAASLAMVDQEIFLFEGTVADNITLWNPTIGEAAMIQAARDACIHDDVSARPDGYASAVEEGGRNFSGGQAQRLEIARALVGNPSLLVLDEATSALDPIVEKEIDANLRRRGCACVIVAHRLSTIRDCDEIVVLEAGKVVQRGTHEEMRDVDGPYARLIAS